MTYPNRSVDEPEKILKEYQVLKEGHFVLTSGLHSQCYFEKFRILEHPELVTLFAQKIADHFKDKKIDVVCGPTTGGIIIAFEVARLIRGRCLFAERSQTGRAIGRGFEIRPVDKILVVDDVLTTGGSIRETLDALKPFPGEVIAIAVFIDRSEELGWDIPLFSVYRQPVTNYQPENCPLCKRGVPVQVPGGKSKK